MTRLLRRAMLHLEATGEVEAMAALSPIGEIVWWGPGAVELFGWAPEEVRGRSAFEIFVAVDTNAQLSAVLAEARQRRDARWVATLRRRDGRAVTVCAALRLAFDGSSIAFVAHEAARQVAPAAAEIRAGADPGVAPELLAAASAEVGAIAGWTGGHADAV